MDFSPLYLLLGVNSFWLAVFVFSIIFFRRSLRVPTESELEQAQEQTHAHDASTGVEESARASVAH